jgi:selenocysteine lyase/cysteine desulfurase
MKYFMAGSALSLSALNELNASIYQSITTLNQKYFEDESPDGAYWEALKDQFLFEDGLIMMNNGTVGPMPKPVFNTLLKYFKMQVTNPFDVYNYIPEKREEVRFSLAKFVNASPDEVAMTANTTEGLNFVANGVDMKEGDEVIVSNMEHPGAINPWRLKQKRFGIKIVEVPFGLPPKSIAEVVDACAAAITPRTKIISCGHTVYVSGLISPLKELSKLAHDKGILMLGDSAHGIGMLDLNLKGMGVDFFASSPYKWLGAPTGVGLFFVRKEAQDKLWPTTVTGGWDTNAGARKYEGLGQRADALIFALGEAINFNSVIGKDRVEKRIKTLAGYLKRGLKNIPGIKVHTPDDPYLSAGLTAFSLDGVDPEQVVEYVRDKYNIVVRTIGSKEKGSYAVRVSTPIYIGFKEIEMFLEGVKHLMSRRSPSAKPGVK